MQLCDWILDKGDDESAVLFGVTPRAVQSWRLGERLPLPRQAAVIVRRTKGNVGWDDIYGHLSPKD